MRRLTLGRLLSVAFGIAFAIMTLAFASGGKIFAHTDGGLTYSTASADARWGREYMPNVPAIDQDGNTYRFYDDLIKGKKVIINFIYTGCSEICPLTTSRLVVLQEKLGAAVGRDFFMYSITIDPEHDGPAELKKYADAFHVGPGWRFLTGKPEDIALIREKLGERSKTKADHKQEIMLGDDARESWSRNSVFGDIDELAWTIRSMDPNFRLSDPSVATASQPNAVEIVPGQLLFASMCEGCHTIGGGVRAGPDLKNVADRRSTDWLKSFISRPDQMFARMDPTALSLEKKFPAVRMPALGLSPMDANDVLSYISRMSKPIVSAASEHKPSP